MCSAGDAIYRPSGVTATEETLPELRQKSNMRRPRSVAAVLLRRSSDGALARLIQSLLEDIPRVFA
jgi:hypothetical protein